MTSAWRLRSNGHCSSFGGSNVLESIADHGDVRRRPVGLQLGADVERLVLEGVAHAREQHDEPHRRPEERREGERAQSLARLPKPAYRLRAR